MKLFKIIILFSIIILAIFTFTYLQPKKVTYSPISDQNNFYKNLDLAIKTANIKTSLFEVRDFNNEVEFYLVDNDNSIKVVVSTLKDPFWQIATLQQVVKTAKINQGKLKLVDLSSTHPYVTLKNN